MLKSDGTRSILAFITQIQNCEILVLILNQAFCQDSVISNSNQSSISITNSATTFRKKSTLFLVILLPLTLNSTTNVLQCLFHVFVEGPATCSEVYRCLWQWHSTLCKVLPESAPLQLTLLLVALLSGSQLINFIVSLLPLVTHFVITFITFHQFIQPPLLEHQYDENRFQQR